MSTITTKDGTQIYYNDWRTGQTVVFSHGWPLSSEAFHDREVDARILRGRAVELRSPHEFRAVSSAGVVAVLHFNSGCSLN